MEWKFNIGQLVKIREDAKRLKIQDNLTFNSLGKMDEHIGQCFNVTERYLDLSGRYRRYKLDGMGWSWAEDWLEFPLKVKDVEESELLSILKQN